MKLSKTKFLILFSVCILLAKNSSAQKPIVIEFNGTGQLIAGPPAVVKANDVYQFNINFSKSYFDTRTKSAIELYLAALENIRTSELYGFIDQSTVDLFRVRCSLIKQIRAAKYHLSPGDTAIIEQRIRFLGDTVKCDTSDNVPDLKTFIDPSYEIEVACYDELDRLLKTKTLSFKKVPETTVSSKHYKLQSDTIIGSASTSTIKFELREINKLNMAIQKQLSKKSINVQQDALVNALKSIKAKMDRQFLAEYATLKSKVEEGKFFFADPKGTLIDTVWVKNSITLLETVSKKTNTMLNVLHDDIDVKTWLLDWMWLTRGLPKTNPFEFQAQPLFPAVPASGLGKVTDREKALVDIFDMMVAKESFKISIISPTLDKDLEVIAGLKARIKAESAISPISNTSDTFWYNGIMKSTRSDEKTRYMVLHDAANQYKLMTAPPAEINEEEQVFIYTQNKKTGEPTRIEVTPTAITSDMGNIAEELDKSMLKDEIGKGGINADVAQFLSDFAILNKKIEFLQSLNAAPKLPLLFTKSSSPIYQSEPLIYNTVFVAPQSVEYKLITGPADKPIEVFKRNFRVNKLYNLRFQAGLLYSGLQIAAYTQNLDNTFLRNQDQAGIDGTFGVQIFPWKTDIRKINVFDHVRVAPFIYAGFSMKNITQNFYPGLGLEIFSGLSIAYIGHVGRTQILTGDNGLANQITNKWIYGHGAAILIDAKLFVDLFKFGSNKSHIGI